jgi:glycosyltransferase involved in cell wall biosynthesis
MPGAEALSQEIAVLRRHWPGELVYLNPNSHSPIRVPRLLFGFHRLRELRRLERDVDIHHLYNPDPFPFLILRWLQKPVVYTISSGVNRLQKPNRSFFSSIDAVVVADERSFKLLQDWGLSNVFLVRSGVDADRFSYSPVPVGKEIKLLVASAPWTLGQFRTKGVEALLEATRRSKWLKLIFLWRGVLADEMFKRVRQMGLESRVSVINELTDVNRALAGVHGTVALATTEGIIKSYPHSLLDSLAGGKPVLVSRAIPMADYVEQTGCGVVVDQVNAGDILAGIEKLVRNYESFQQAALEVGQHDFRNETMVESFAKVYDRVLSKSQ